MALTFLEPYMGQTNSGELFFDQAIIKIVNANHLELLDGEFGESPSFHRLADSL